MAGRWHVAGLHAEKRRGTGDLYDSAQANGAAQNLREKVGCELLNIAVGFAVVFCGNWAICLVLGELIAEHRTTRK